MNRVSPLKYWTGVVKRKGMYHTDMTKSEVASAVHRIVTGNDRVFVGNQGMQYLSQQYRNVQNLKQEDGQVVYFIGNREHKWVKIGHTGNIKARLSAIQVGCPFKVCVLGTLKVTKDTAKDSESMLHKRFERNKINGEWFNLTDEMEKLIENHVVEHKKAKVMPTSRVIPPIDFMTERKIAQRQKPRRR